MTGGRTAAVDAALTLVEILVSGVVVVLFFVAWLCIAFVRVVADLPGAVVAVRRRRKGLPIVALHADEAG